MDLDKPHHNTTTTTSDLFICFTSTMKLSKSILSPNHTRDQPLSLPTSLSRRLKTNGSIKGGQSPMFPSTNKKRGSNFDNPEPSSPKVTCIGQVKMKTKKKVKQTRSLSNRKSDLSFRKLEQTPDKVLNQIQRSSSVHFQAHQECVSHRNQRWVHLPLTIYEALREFSCLIPCRSSCFSTNGGEKEEKFNGSREVSNRQRSCGDIFARWLVALQEGEGEKPMGVELVVTNKEGEDDRIEEMQSRMRSSRRHVFEDIEFKEESVDDMKQDEEKARVSICVPPKNALLLMRCRSDPTKMADLTNRFWESPSRKENDVEENEQKDKKDIRENELVEVLVDAQKCEELEKECEVLDETSVSVNLVKDETIPEVVQPHVMEMEIESKDEEMLKKIELALESEREEEEVNSVEPEKEGETEFVQVCPHPPNLIDEESFLTNKHKEEEADSSIQSYSSFSESSDSESSKTTNEADILVEEATLEVEEEKFRSSIRKEIEEILLLEGIDLDAKQTEKETKSDDVEKADVVQIEYRKESVLPDCLLLMMCEPKLSMEVSKETWVCSTDFIIPQRKQVKKEIPEEPKRRRSIDSKPVHTMQDNRSKQLMQPPRSSCSFPAKSMATMIEQKLVNAVAYEPFVLTRCKSEPMRTAAAKVGAAGIGF